MIEYDIVIIGGTAAGRFAALQANQYGAKVALVEPSTYPQSICLDALIEIRRNFPPNPPIQWQELIQQMLQMELHLQELDTPAILNAKGVDIVYGDGKFQSQPSLAFTINNRQLRGRKYLLANGSIPTIPDIEGLDTATYLTLNNFWQAFNTTTPPQNWAILGGTPQSIELAQVMRNLGFSVTFILQQKTILPGVDEEIAFHLQAQLEASGIQVLTKSPVTQVKLIDDKKWLQVGNRAIETDEIVIARGQQPNLQLLNLADTGVKYSHNHLLVNNRLQTTNKQIYACGDILGGYVLGNIANYEAQIAVKNALFFGGTQINYEQIPWGISTHPNLAQVGITETQAGNRYDSSQILVIKQYFKTLIAAQISRETTGFCKLVLRKDGTILGATILGKNASELINIITLAIQKKLKISSFQNLAPIQPSCTEILTELLNDWQKAKTNPHWQEFLEDYFHFRRQQNW